MSCCEAQAVCVPLGGGPVLLGRIGLNSGSLVQQADLEKIEYLVLRGVNAVGSDELEAAEVIHNVLQTDARWKPDKTGYNFEWDAPHTLFPQEDAFTVVVTFTPTSGNPVVAKWSVIVEGH
ncbi:hypothetical protein [Bremerella cremea]|uniref:hypothetical protein n=1 Tax=Bremerella cremea TaxID=1031537 RepID=UPI0031E64C36